MIRVVICGVRLAAVCLLTRSCPDPRRAPPATRSCSNKIGRSMSARVELSVSCVKPHRVQPPRDASFFLSFLDPTYCMTYLNFIIRTRHVSFMRHFRKICGPHKHQRCGGNTVQNCLKPTTPSRSTGVRTHGWCHSVGNQMINVTKPNRNRQQKHK